MNRLNLIPIHRRRAKARHGRLRIWIVANCAYLVLMLTFAGVGYLMLASSNSPEAELLKVNAETEQSNKQVLAVRQQLAEAHQTLASLQAASEEPDWSVLVAVVAKSMGDGIVLNRCDVAAVKDETVQTVSLLAKPGAAAAASPSPKRVLLHLAGLGRSQTDVAQFVLRVEGTDLFEHVNLLHTSRQLLMGNDAVGFELDCPMAGRIEETP